jgi:hypothetical protein
LDRVSVESDPSTVLKARKQSPRPEIDVLALVDDLSQLFARGHGVAWVTLSEGRLRHVLRADQTRVVPQLESIASDESETPWRRLAAVQLAHEALRTGLGNLVVPLLLAPDSAVRRLVLVTMEEAPPNSKTPSLVKLLDDPDPEIRRQAMRTGSLGRLPGFAEDLLEWSSGHVEYDELVEALQLLASSGLAEGVLQHIAELLPRAPDWAAEKLVEGLTRLARKKPEEESEVRAIVERHAPRYADKLEEGAELREVLASLVECGVLRRMPSDEDLQRVETEEGDPDAIASAFESVGQGYCFDAEAGVAPPPHDELLYSIAEKCGDVVNLEAVFLESSDDLGGKDVLQFVHRERLYKAILNDNGDYYDAEPVVAAVNRALADSGAAEQWFVLENGEQQSVSCIFARADRVRAAVAEDLLELSRHTWNIYPT